MGRSVRPTGRSRGGVPKPDPEAEKSSWWSRNGAAFGAILAAAAAIATAVIASESNSADTQRRIEHELALARRDATGAARVLAKELATVEVYLQGMLRVDRLISYDSKYNVQLSTEDQKRIAAAPEIGVDRWQRIATALSNLDALEGYIRSEYRRGGMRPLHRGHVAVFQLDIESIDRAWEALDPLSGTPKLPNPRG
jgi:hypothetical protein